MKKQKKFEKYEIKNERDLKREEINNKDKIDDKKEVPTLNTLSIILYSFGLTFIELLTFDLVISNVNISDYEMNITLGYIITFIIISAVTVIYMADRFEDFRENYLDTKVNKVFTFIGIFSTIILANIFLNKTLFSLNIVTVIIVTIMIFVLGRIIEKKDKSKRK